MGAVASVVATAVASVVAALLSSRPSSNPTIDAIHDTERLRRQEEEQRAAAAAAQAEADRLRREAEMEIQRAQEAEERAQAAMSALNAAREETEKARREAVRIDQARKDEIERVQVALQKAEDAARVTAEEKQNAQVAHDALEILRAREVEERAQAAMSALNAAREETENARREAVRSEQARKDEVERVQVALQRAEDAARVAAEEKQNAQGALDALEIQLQKGIRPVIEPTGVDVARVKARVNYAEGFYHFAIAGVSGSGKSSLINALRGLKNKDQGAAKAGVTETTQEIGRYEDRDGKPIVWYDIPGAGTLKVSDWQYFHDQGLYVFDALVVLIDNRFTMTDVAIIMNCARFRIPCYLVRSKCDIQIRNVMIENGYDSEDDNADARAHVRMEREAREHVIQVTRQSVHDNLQEAGIPDQRVYLISNKSMVGVVQASSGRPMPKRIMDELELLRDLLGDAHHRRGQKQA